MDRNERFAKNTLILSIGIFLPKLASLITLPVLTGRLSKTEYGTYDVILILVSLFLPALTLQLKQAVFRFLIEERENEEGQKKLITTAASFVTLISIAATAVFFFLMPSEFKEIRALLCIYILLDMLNAVLQQIARGLAQNFAYSIASIVNSLMQMIFIVLLVSKASMGLTGVLTALNIGSMCSVIYLSYACRIHKFISKDCYDSEYLKKMISYSWPMVPNELSLWVVRVSNRLVITGFLGLERQAVYAVANKIPSLISLAQSTITLAWQENATLVSKDDDVENYYSQMFKTMMSFQAGFLGAVIAFTPILFKILIRGDYAEAYFHMPLLCIGIFYSSMATFLGGIYVAFKASKDVGITTTLAAAINIVITVLFIKKIGLYAASVATAISYICLCLYRMANIRKHVNITYDVRHFVLLNILMIVECVLCFRNNMYLNVVNAILGLGSFLLLNRKLLTVVFRTVFKKLMN